MRTAGVRRIGALLVGVSMVAAACGGDDDDDAGDATPPEETTPGSDASETTTGSDTTEPTDATMTTEASGTSDAPAAECGAAASDVTDGALSGFAGTTPFGELTDEFIARLCEVDPSLTDLNYATETYDAIVITALAVEIAQDDGIAHASEIVGVTRDGTKCTAFAECKELIEAGEDIDYDGASGPLTFSGVGEPLDPSYGLLRIGDNNRIDITQTEYISIPIDEAADVPVVPVEGSREGDGVLTIGSILPQTGSLAFLGPPEFAGFDLAIQEINEAGGVLGTDVVGIPGDSGDTSTNQADQTVDRLLAENADAIIGAASSSVTLTVIDKVVGAGVTLFSPANTSTTFTDYPDKGLYFRTAPPDVYQGNVLGQFVVNDGNQSVAIINLNDEYGNGLADEATAVIEESGGEVVIRKTYDAQAPSFDTEIAEIAATDPDAVLVIGFNESSKILRTMVENGIGPRDLAVYGCDGNIGNALGEDFDAGN